MEDGPEQTAPLKDPYEALGLDKGATEDQIKGAYKKAALRYHPDKNRGERAEEAADKFREICTAYSILSDPDKKRRYDAGGYENLEASDVEVDLSSMGTMNTMVAAMFSKLGVPIKTAVSQAVLDVAAQGTFPVTRLEFGHPVKGKVDKQEAVFFEVEITQQQIDEGFYIFAHSSIGSKFKLLMFEQGSESENSRVLKLQEESMKTGKSWTTAGLFFLSFDTYSLGPKLSALETAEDPESVLFRRLDTLRPRESASLAPGVHTLAVYGDNWFKRGQYQIEAVRAQRPGTWGNALALRDVEASLLAKKEEMKKFEKEFRRVQSQFLELCEEFQVNNQELEDMLKARDDSYLKLFDTSAGPGPSTTEKARHTRSGSIDTTGRGELSDGGGDEDGDGKPKKDRSPLSLGGFKMFGRRGK